MATYTPNYNLEKPDASDKFEDFRQSYNDNMDKIDNISGGGGSAHTIVDNSGTSLPSESKLQFTDGLDAYDSTGKTVAKVNTTFTEAVTRTNIASGDTFATILGKIKKFFTDLKTVAFSGDYNDLDNLPTIPDNVNYYGTCDTATNISTKVVTCAEFVLAKYAIIAVTFDHAVDASDNMDVNGTGAKIIYHDGMTIGSGVINDGDTATFIYTGSHYLLLNVDTYVRREELTEIFEESNTATHAISKGQYFYLYKDLSVATDDIAVGDTFTYYTNYIDVRKGALNELEGQKVNRSGDTMSGSLKVYAENEQTAIRARYIHTSTTSQSSDILVGNNISDGTAGATHGRLRLYNKTNQTANIQATKISSSRNIEIPDKSGTLALESDLCSIVQSGTTATQSISAGTYFYLNGTLVRAVTNIQNGDTFTSGTNYISVSVGGLNDLYSHTVQVSEDNSIKSSIISKTSGDEIRLYMMTTGTENSLRLRISGSNIKLDKSTSGAWSTIKTWT